MNYSPICDTDKGAYLSYLFANVVHNGSGPCKLVSKRGGDSCDQGGCCRDRDGEFALRLCRGFCVAAGIGFSELDFTGASGGGGGYLGSIAGAGGGSCARADVGVASGDDSGGDGGVDSGVCAGQRGNVEPAGGGGAATGLDRDGTQAERVPEPVVDGSRGKNWERNQLWKSQKREKKDRRRAAAVSTSWLDDRCKKGRQVESVVAVDTELKESSRQRWIAANELAAEEARRKLAVLKANDIEDEVRRYRTKVKGHTESNMVKIEKTHAFLKATGNVPGAIPVDVVGADGVGTVQTVLSGQTISPDSSASQHEYRELLKKLADVEALNEKYKRAMAKLGISVESADAADKRTWTENSENDRILEELYPYGFAMDKEFAPPGKFRVVTY